MPSVHRMRRSRTAASVTAGLKWPPDASPAMAIAAISPSPNANGTITITRTRLKLWPPKSNALATPSEPTPTSTNVPTASATSARQFIDASCLSLGQTDLGWSRPPKDSRRRGRRDSVSPESGSDGERLGSGIRQLQDDAAGLAADAVRQLLDQGRGSAAGHLDFDHGRTLNPRRVSLSVTMIRMPRVSLDLPAIEVIDLRKRYGAVEAPAGLTMTVGRGEVFGFLGPNGAGKTTTVKLLLGLARPTSGSGRGLGAALGDLGARGQMGYLPGRFRH